MYVTPVTILCFLVYFRITDCNDISMSIKPQLSLENNSVSFKCSAGYDALTLAFSQSFKTVVYSVFNDSSCVIRIGTRPEFVDQCTCDYQTKSLECFIATISRRENGLWQCEDFFGPTLSTFVALRVTVPIQKATIQSDVQNVTINDTKQLSLICEAPNGIPVANISWFLDKQTPNQSTDDTDITEFSSVTIWSKNDGTKTAESTLSFNVSAEHNGMTLFCTANNTAEVNVFSRRIHLNIIYNPDKHVLVSNQTHDVDFYLIRNSNTKQSLQCQVDGGNPMATLKWSCYDGIQSNGNSQSSAISTVTWIAADLTDSTCICYTSHILGWNDWRVVYIHVYYEPNPPTCTIGSANVSKGVLNITLNSNVRITCKSDGNPSPENFVWILPTGYTFERKTLSLSQIQLSHDGLYILSVENIMKPSIGEIVNGRSNTTFDMNIQYGPRSLQFYFRQSGKNITSRVIYVIKGDETSIVAFADARPHPTYIWSNFQVGEEISHEFHYDTNISCNVSNVLYPTGFNTIQKSVTKTFQVQVLYPPEVPILRFNTCNSMVEIEDSIVNVVSNQLLIVTCFAKAKPEPSYRWNNSLANELFIAHVTKNNSATYICYASNTMITSYGKSVKGQNETLFILDVIYPPQISNAETKLVAIEGSNFSIYCNVSLGNPRETFVTWISDSDAEVEKAGQLINFLNISRTDEGNFTCIARNRMKPTGCAEEDGVDKQQFYVDVQYKARIQRFAALSATVNHTEELSFVCDIDSDPPASVSIMSTNGTTLHFTRGNNQLRYRKNSSCLDDNGNFTCTSENKHNGGSPESRNVTVDVRCSPIYPRNYSPETVVKSQIGDQTILNFSIFSNPLPTSVIWTNLSNNMQLHANTSESDRVFIDTSDDMRSSVVVIKSIEPWDSGNYSVRVKNEFGNLTETFHIVLDASQPTTNIIAHVTVFGGLDITNKSAFE
ncbi:hemicentin-1-like [Mya arenaria]|uniref:hemicentin-1-like n=1 Tax=Mya arenaria TaxID=6604 RepID=UPI0022E84437|nr:hemicentin-1-like [Mya arenaria]